MEQIRDLIVNIPQQVIVSQAQVSAVARPVYVSERDRVKSYLKYSIKSEEDKRMMYQQVKASLMKGSVYANTGQTQEELHLATQEFCKVLLQDFAYLPLKDIIYTLERNEWGIQEQELAPMISVRGLKRALNEKKTSMMYNKQLEERLIQEKRYQEDKKRLSITKPSDKEIYDNEYKRYKKQTEGKKGINIWLNVVVDNNAYKYIKANNLHKYSANDQRFANDMAKSLAKKYYGNAYFMGKSFEEICLIGDKEKLMRLYDRYLAETLIKIHFKFRKKRKSNLAHKKRQMIRNIRRVI